MLVDIQGAGYFLTGPEIVTTHGSFDKEGLLFCVSNLEIKASATVCATSSEELGPAEIILKYS